MLTAALVVEDGAMTTACSELITRSSTSDHYRMALLVVHRTSNRSTTMRDAVFRIVQRLESWGLRRSSGHGGPHDERRPTEIELPRLVVTPESAEGGYRYPEEALRRIRDAGVDVLVDARVSEAPSAEVAAATRYGMLYVRHTTPTREREGPPGFPEALAKEPCTSFEIRHIHDGGDRVVLQGSIPTDPFCSGTERRLHCKGCLSVHPLLEELGRDGSLPAAAAGEAQGLPGRTGAPPLLRQAAYVATRIGPTVRRLADRLLRRGLRWNVAYQPTGDWRSADLGRSVKIENRPYHFLADPFLWERDGRTVCFVEDFDIRAQRGGIVAYEIDDGGHVPLGEVLREPFHMSYPFVFEADGELFMCPETLENRDIRIYRCIEFPLEWTLHEVLMSEVAAVDTCIFFHSGTWWMLTGMDPSGVGEGFDLHAFSADRFDSDRWMPHPGNPVVAGCERARNGGLITEDGKLLRVFQTQEFGIYGGSLGIAEITRLTPHEYEERVVARIEPGFFPRISGTHTLSFRNGTLAIDYLRRERYTR